VVLALLIVPAFAGNDKNFTYLALGDSVAFGFDPTLLPTSGQPLPTPSEFTGYPEVVAQAEHWFQSGKLSNASCPGETSGSFYIPGAPDNGCHSVGPGGQPSFKAAIGLHTNYSGTQLQYAVSELSTNKHINLVTLGIGSNDVLLLLGSCVPSTDPNCVLSQLPGLLYTYGQNLTQILTAIRANYSGTLILAKTYSPSPSLNSIAQQLNSVTVKVGAPFGARFADGYTAFQLASALFQGDPCKAGLLIRLSSTTCDVHPSPAGRDLLAATVELAMLGIQ
jgi:lysophospholipase L1-like esterase